jgi:hypothetical protein
MAKVRHFVECCRTLADTRTQRGNVVARGNPGLRKRGPGTSIEAAQLTGYGSFLIGRRGFDRPQSGPTVATALRTNG